MNRLIIERIEGRILLGITMFIAIMILIGWVAINEPARMAAFEQQHTGRSTERGAELFAANCSTCHNVDGRGIAGRAPALNNPQLFGHNFVADLTSQIGRNQRVLDELPIQISEVEAERETIFDQIVNLTEEEQQSAEGQDLLFQLRLIDLRLNSNADELAAIRTGIENADEAVVGGLSEEQIAQLTDALDTNVGAQAPALTQANTDLVAQLDDQIAQMQQARNNNYLPDYAAKRAEAESSEDWTILTNYINEDSNRLTQIGFGGDISGYLTTTLIHGRPGSGDVWGGNIMVAWSQRAGGPLRDDEIGDIVNYILNWDRGDNWTLSDLNQVNQFALIHADARLVSAGGEGSAAVGTDVAAILENLPVGDAARGEQLYDGQIQSELGFPMGCQACHAGGVVGPNTEGTWSRVETVRLADPALAGYTVEQYIVESIVNPTAYSAEGKAGMPENFGTQLSIQDIADLMAYLQSQG